MSIAKEGGLSIPDMLLRYNLSQGVAVVTKSSSYERQKAAASEMQSLPPETLKKLDAIGHETKAHRFINPPFMYRPGAPWAWGIKM
jgi:diketogulonate reductase-like aldo/keto reductase